MCDTVVVVQPDRILFAKNSDRDPNEGQNLEWHRRRTNSTGARLKCTWIEIADVPETFATLLSRPFWIWGAEMGTNEHGVMIGNEAVFTRDPKEPEPGLIGMDLLRLALERADTARGACEVITELLNQYGQGGGCGHESKKFAYDNSFIVADRKTAFVLETAGRAWAIEEVKGARSISNSLTLPGFRQSHSDFIKTRFCGCQARRRRTQHLAEQAHNVLDMMGILRDHGAQGRPPEYKFVNGGLETPCVHGGGFFASSQTTASWVVDLKADTPIHWVTATAAPCTGLFKPVRLKQPIDTGLPARDVMNDSLWWRHERFHRRVVRNPVVLTPLFAPERDAQEKEWVASPPDSVTAFQTGRVLLQEWTEAVTARECDDTRPKWTQRYWEKRREMAAATGVESVPSPVSARR